MYLSCSSSPKVGFLFFSRKRPGFNPEWGREVERKVTAFAETCDYDCYIAPTHPVDDATLRQAIAELEEAGADVLVALQSTMSDGRMAPVLQQVWGRPVVLWATAETPGASKVGACSLVGTHAFGALYAQMGVPFEFVYGMPDESHLEKDFNDAIQSAYAFTRLKSARVGLIGRHAPGFLDMEVDPFVLHRVFGTQLHHLDLHEFLERFAAVGIEEVKDDRDKVLELGLPMEGVTEDDLLVQSRYYLALRELIAEESLDALALRCWPELPNVTGQWAYLAMVRLASENYPVAMEGDADGALTCLIGEVLGMGQGFLSDWLEHDDERITLWHPGNAPFALAPPIGSPGGPKLARHFNNDKPTVVDSRLPENKRLTLFRLWRMGDSYRACCIEGSTVEPVEPLSGTYGRFQPDGGGVREHFEEWLHAGFPHHIAVFPGSQKRRLQRLLRMLKMNNLQNSKPSLTEH